MSGPRWLRLGTVARPQGLRGEIRVNPDSGDPSVFTSLKRIAWSRGGEPVGVRGARMHKRQAIFRPEGVESIAAAEPLVGREVWVRRDWLPPPEEGTYYWADLVGCRVEAAAGGVVGEVTALEDYGAHAILVVALPGGGEARVPFVEPIVRAVDLAAGRIEIEPPPGLLE